MIPKATSLSSGNVYALSETSTVQTLDSTVSGQSLAVTLAHQDPVAAPSQYQGVVTPPIADEPPRLVMQPTGPRHMRLSETQKGGIVMTLDRPPIKTLVLSGGGAKGAAYPGAVDKLEAEGVLATIDTISGASAGAITAVLLASGMTAAEFKALSNRINFLDLLDSPEEVEKKAIHAKPVAVSSKQQSSIGRVISLLPHVNAEALYLEKLLRDESKKTLLSRIQESFSEEIPSEVLTIRDKLLAPEADVTFADLATLNKYIPQVKKLIIDGTMMADKCPQLIVFGEQLEPTMSIARAAHISGAFPWVFKEVEEQSGVSRTEAMNDRETVKRPYLDKNTLFKDGGLMMNTPVPALFDRTFHRSPLRDSESLILEFETYDTPDDKVDDAQPFQDWFAGVPVTAKYAMLVDGLASFKDQIVTVPLTPEGRDYRSQLGGTLNFAMPLAEKIVLQQHLEAKVDAHLKHRAIENHEFSSLEEAVLAMSDELLKSVEGSLPPEAEQTLAFRHTARAELLELESVIENRDFSEFDKDAEEIFNRLDKLAGDNPTRLKWLGNELNQPESKGAHRLLNIYAGRGEGSSVLMAGLKEMAQRDISTIAWNIKQDVLYPSLFSVGQPVTNKLLLRQAMSALDTQTTKEGVCDILKEVEKNYGARNKPWKRPISSNTVKQLALRRHALQASLKVANP